MAWRDQAAADRDSSDLPVTCGILCSMAPSQLGSLEAVKEVGVAALNVQIPTTMSFSVAGYDPAIHTMSMQPPCLLKHYMYTCSSYIEVHAMALASAIAFSKASLQKLHF